MDARTKKALMDFGKRLAQLRKSRGLGVDALAEMSHLSKGSIESYESGRREPKMLTLQLLAGVFDVSIDALVTGEGLPPMPPALPTQRKPPRAPRQHRDVAA